MFKHVRILLREVTLFVVIMAKLIASLINPDLNDDHSITFLC